MVPTYRVSHLNTYLRWKEDEDSDINWLYRDIFASEPTEPMERGTAFHKALETAAEGEYSTVQANGYTFAFTCEAEISLPKTREIRKYKDYGGIIITGQCDGVEGRAIIDHKTTQQFDAEKYHSKFQWRFYLDLFEADRFDWHIWEMAEIKQKSSSVPARDISDFDYADPIQPITIPYEVYAHHLLTQYRYPAMEEDCRRLAVEFRDFAARMNWKGRAA